MINIKTLPIPQVIEEVEYEVILNKNIDLVKKILKEKRGIDWTPSNSDDYSLMLQAFSYREVHFRSELNERIKQLFLAYAQDSNLDHRAVEYDIERLKGSNPYAKYEFSIPSGIDSEVVIEKGLVLTDETSKYESKLLDSLTIVPGETKVTGTVELQKEISELDIKTEIITNSLPYVLSAKSLEKFANGADVENNEKLLYRILLSFADKSTAGSEETYKSYTYKADERIQDVKVQRGVKDIFEFVTLLIGANESKIREVLADIYSKMGMVEVYYYSDKSDDLMKQRIEEKLNDKKTRPLSDTVIVSAAEIINFYVAANLKVYLGQEIAQILINAKASLEKGLKELVKIGESITLSEINKFLKVDGVKEVIISHPTTNIIPQSNQIGVNDVESNSITAATI